MDILNSDWLIAMLNKAGNKPQARMLALFDIINDWVNAPMTQSPCLPNSPPNTGALHTFLRLEASKAGASLPDMLATQLCIMAHSALQEALQSQQHASLLLAKNAAAALIKVQTEKEFRIPKKWAYLATASILGICLVGSELYFWHKHKTNPQVIVTTQPASDEMVGDSMATPEATAALVAQIEQMRSGDCHLIEALQLPDSYKKVYFENIVMGRISSDPTEQKLVREILDKISCNYTPMLMRSSK